MKKDKICVAVALLLLTWCSVSPTFACPVVASQVNDKNVKQHAQQLLTQLKSGKVQLDAVLPCLSSENANVRDGIGYSVISGYLRGEEVELAQVKTTLDKVTMSLQSSPSLSSWSYSFHIMALAELVRVDRIQPFLSDAQRDAIVTLLSTSFANIKDYRGWTDEYGWIHQVAHHADVLLQLALNKNTSKAQLTTLAEALSSQISPSSHHAYIHGESDRLARASIYMMLRENLPMQFWTAFVEQLSVPTSAFTDWGAAYNSSSGLALMHNRQSYLDRLYIWTQGAKNPRILELQPIILKARRSIG